MFTVKHIVIGWTGLLMVACVKDKPQPINVPPVSTVVKHRVFVLNEGNYGVGNAALSLYDPDNQTVVEDYYRAQNTAGLGDVLQSMIGFRGRYYLVVNNSGKVVVCDSSMKKTGQIGNLLSPRYMLPINNDKAYVSDLYANQIHVVDLNGMVKTKSIGCKGWTEHMVACNNEVFVENIRSAYMYVVNAVTDAVSDSIAVSVNGSGLVLDKNNHLWFLSSGEKSKNIWPVLYEVNTQTHQVLRQFNFSMNEAPSHLCLNGGRDTLYFINGGICQMPVVASALPASAFIPANSRNFYGLTIGAVDHKIYVSDALDYIQQSNCYVYNPSGQLLSSFKAGINANGFYIE